MPASMTIDPEGLVSFEAAGEKYTAVFGFRAMKAAEAHYGLPFFQAIQKVMPQVSPEDAGDRAKIAAAAAGVNFTDIGTLFGFALLKHHPALTDADIEDLIDEIGLSRTSEIIGKALASALSDDGGEGDAGSPANPPRPAGRKGKTG